MRHSSTSESKVFRTAWSHAALPDSVLTRPILRNYHGNRPGGRYVVIESHHFVHKFGDLRVAARCAVRCKRDRAVPGTFAVGKLTVQTRSLPIAPHDVVPSLASYPRIEPPLGSIGCPLGEVLVP